MIRKRRNAYLAGLFMFVGTVFLIVGTFVPVIDLTTNVGLDFDHLSINPTSGVDATGTLPVMETSAFFLILCAILLAITRRRGLGIVWRVLAGLSVVLPVVLTATFWVYVAHPDEIAKSDDLPLPTRFMGAIAALHAGDASPGIGLWLLSAGCLLIALGCLVPAKRSKQLVIDEDDPGYQHYNPHMYQFGQYQAQRYPPPISQRAPVDDGYGPPRYQG